MNSRLDDDKRIIGEKIYLRPIEEKDSELIVKWRNQENVRRYFFYQKDFTLEGQKQWYETKVKTGEVYQFIVCDAENEKPIGCTYIQGFNEDRTAAESGIFIGENEVRGRGVGKEALALTAKFAFDELGLEKLNARAFEGNKASVNAHLGTGYRITDSIEQEIIPSKELVETVLMELINE